MLDFVPINLLRHLMGPVSISPELKFRVRPLFTALDLSEGEVRRHNDSIEPLVVYQT